MLNNKNAGTGVENNGQFPEANAIEIGELEPATQPEVNPQTPAAEAAEANDERLKFPAECLPGHLRHLADNVAAATRTPEVISYAAGLGAVAAALGRGLQLETLPGEFVMANLYQIPVAESGTGKSRAGSKMLAEIFRIHDELQDGWKETFRESQAELDDINDTIEKLKRDLKGGKCDRTVVKKQLADLYKEKEDSEKLMVKPELYTQSATEPKLATLLRDNGEVINTITFEAGAAVQIVAGKYTGAKVGVTTDDTLLLVSYSQERYKNDRATTDCVDLRRPTVNLLWMVQPRYIPALWGNQSLSTGGFLARCLAFNSGAEAQELTGYEPVVNADLQGDFNGTIRELWNAYGKNKLLPATVMPTKAAREAMRHYHNKCVRLRRDDLRDIQQFPARWCENAWKVALNIHAMIHGKESHLAELSEVTAQCAISILEWYSDQFLKLMNGGREDKLTEDGQWLFDYILGKGEEFQPKEKKSMAVRTVARNRSISSEDLRQIVNNNRRILAIKSVIKDGQKSDRVYVV
jgi:hypothetical protein